ncbi:MAG: right-handed parallel beta-helix repeat-containing protein [Candidatus Bathyarchaeales archaeon]
MTVSVLKKLFLTIVLIFLLIGIVNVQQKSCSAMVDSSIIRVPDDYSTIQGAVNAASSGDTILISSGVYFENILVNKSVRLIGEQAANTIVEGFRGFFDTILVTAGYVEIAGLTVRNGQAGIFLNSSNHSNIHDNILTANTYWGGIVLRYSNDNTITYNLAKNNGGGHPDLRYGVGISISYSNRNVISSNTITSNVAGSLILGNSHHNTIINNSVYEDASGILLADSTWNAIIANNISKNTESSGIGLCYSSNNTIENNKLAGNWGELHVVTLL